MILRMARFVRRFTRNSEGAAALEFALLLPIFLVIYLCVVEFCQAFMVQRRANHATSMVADIVAQSGQVRRSELNGVFDIAGLIMSPFSAAPIHQRVTSVKRISSTRNEVQWSHTRGNRFTTLRPRSTVTLPAGLLTTNGDSIIMSETIYRYDSPYDIAIPGFPNFLSGVTTFERTFYLRPREVVDVSCLDCPTS